MIKKIILTILMCFYIIPSYAENVEIIQDDRIATGCIIENVVCIEHNLPSYILFTKWKTPRAIKEYDSESEERIDAFFVHLDKNKKNDDASYHFMYKNISGNVYYSNSETNFCYHKLEENFAAKYFYYLLKNNKCH